MWVKICGITDQDDAIKVCEAGADAIGFVFCRKSPRYLAIREASSICAALAGKKISYAGVFVNEEVEQVLEGLHTLPLSFLQFCGEEDKGYIESIAQGSKKIRDVQIIKTIRVPEKICKDVRADLLKKIESLRPDADYILLDTYSKKSHGGTGMSFSWKALRGIGKRHPIIISGGLDAENVEEAIRMTCPYGVDASSRLEAMPGRKDIRKVSHFIQSARG